MASPWARLSRIAAVVLITACEGHVGGDGFVDASVRDAGQPTTPDGGASDAGFDAGAMASTDAGRPDAGITFDAGPPDTGVPDASTRPPGLVPMFVVSGWEGRLVSSCDDGRTWVANDEPHTTTGGEFNDKGIAYAQGVFMQIIGWGALCSFKRTVDGVTWQHLSLDDVGLPPMAECGGIASTGDGFVMLHGPSGQAFLSSDAGLRFSLIGAFDNHEYIRDVGGGGPVPGVIGAGGGNDDKGVLKNPPHFSVDRGLTWKETPGCSTFNAVSVGQNGGVAYGNHRLVFVGYRGQVCVTSDLATFSEAQLDVSSSVVIQGRASFAGGRFWVGNGGTLFVSPDGLNWDAGTLPSGMQLHTVASSDETGTLVAFNQGTSAFYRSIDHGATWLPATGPGTGPNLGRIVFGYGQPSANCPP